jgi:hypothetical protein
LKAAIEDNKWYRSIEAQHDVGWEQAEKDFIKNYLKTWAAGFKVCYCNFVCPARETCKMKYVAGK